MLTIDQPICGDCGGTTIEYDAAAGNGFCVQCGTVVEENTIVTEVTFGETSNGAAMVQGSYVGQGQSEWLAGHFALQLAKAPSRAARARMNGPGGFRGSGESREQTLANGMYKHYQPTRRHSVFQGRSPSEDPSSAGCFTHI